MQSAIIRVFKKDALVVVSIAKKELQIPVWENSAFVGYSDYFGVFSCQVMLQRFQRRALIIVFRIGHIHARHKSCLLIPRNMIGDLFGRQIFCSAKQNPVGILMEKPIYFLVKSLQKRALFEAVALGWTAAAPTYPGNILRLNRSDNILCAFFR